MQNDGNPDNIQRLTITDIGSNGEGVGRISDGRITFVPFTLPDEEISIHLEEIKKNYIFGRLTEIHKKNTERTDAPCHVYEKCGGCALQHLSYKKQLEFKTNLIRSQLKKIAGIDGVEIAPCRPSPKTYNYRNKAVFKLEEHPQGVHIGFFEEGTHNVVNAENCLICGGGINKALEIIRNFIDRYKISVFDADTQTGLLKSLIMRNLQENIFIGLVVSAPSLPHDKELINELKKYFKTFSLVLCVDKPSGNADKTRVLYGTEKIPGNICGVDFELSVKSFLQVNPEVAQAMYNNALQLINPDKNDIVIDAFSGVGILSALFARSAFHVYGIEIIPEATVDAQALMKQNNINNATCLTGDCSLTLPPLLKKLRREYTGKKFTVILDPPRKGCGAQVIDSLISSLPDTIIYISCNSATLSRDLKTLYTKYDISAVVPYDMFPQTADVETLVCLKKREM